VRLPAARDRRLRLRRGGPGPLPLAGEGAVSTCACGQDAGYTHCCNLPPGAVLTLPLRVTYWDKVGHQLCPLCGWFWGDYWHYCRAPRPGKGEP